jgi:hypothetical protein
VTITFNPWGANDPIGYTPEPYDPARLEENWQFIRDVRPVVKQYGPPTTRFDLLNEGGADFWQPQLLDYDVELWTRYVDEFGHGDATISVITNPGTPGGSGSRLQNFIPALRATGRPLPTWFDVHPFWSSAALDDLRHVDAYLRSQGLTQPLTIDELAYDNPEVATAVAAFVRESSRPVLEVMEWPLSYGGAPSYGTCPDAPYRIASYVRALTSTQPYTLHATVSSAAPALVSEGARVKALGAGRYTVVVRDGSRRAGFRLVGQGFDRRTGAAFRGTVRWVVRLREYTRLRYGGLRRTLKAVSVLGRGES